MSTEIAKSPSVFATAPPLRVVSTVEIDKSVDGVVTEHIQPAASTRESFAKTALLYLRVSTIRQATKGGEEEGYSIPAQRRACTTKAAEFEAAVIGEYIDAGQSARSADRPELQAMLSRVKEGGVDYVIVHKLDRLARSLPDHIAITMALKQASVELKSATEVIDETPTDRLTEGLVAVFSEFYSSNLAAEAKKGMLEKVRHGGTPGLAPVGYLNVLRIFGDREGKTVEIDPERGMHITWAYKAYATGNWSIADLVEALEERGLRSRETLKMTGVALNDAQVHRLLKNPYYKGTVVYRRAEYPGNHAPLVDEATWHRVQTILADRRLTGDRSWRRTHYLKGTVFCHRCGSRMSYGRSRGVGGEYDYLFCLGRHTKRTNCDLPYIRAEHVERAVEKHWHDHIRIDDETVDAVRACLPKEVGIEMADTMAAVAAQQRRLIRLERQKAKLVDAYMADAMTIDELKPRQAKVTHEISEAKSLIEAGESHLLDVTTKLDEIARTIKHIAHTYVSVSDDLRKRLNQLWFKRIMVDVDDDDERPIVAASELEELMETYLTVGGRSGGTSDRALPCRRGPTPGSTGQVSPVARKGSDEGTHGPQNAASGRERSGKQDYRRAFAYR